MNQERREQIIEMVKKNRVVKNKELMERFDISIETVRRDLKHLEKQGYLECVYGGAVLKQAAPADNKWSYFEIVDAKNAVEKDAIARAASEIVKGGETIFLEEGSTIYAMVPYLKEITPLTIITNSLRIAIAMHNVPGCTVILPGGRVAPGSMELTGFQTDENMKIFNINKAFIGTSGITETHFTDYSVEDRRYIRRQIIRDSDQAIVVADHTKFGVRATVNVAAVSELAAIVTDDKTPVPYIRKIEENGVRVIVAKVE